MNTCRNLKVEKEIKVVLPLKAVLPSTKITLPVDETFNLKIVGGSGYYQYQIDGDQRDIATISSSGTITSRKQGQSAIIVKDKKVPRNRIILELVVSGVGSLIPLEKQK